MRSSTDSTAVVRPLRTFGNKQSAKGSGELWLPFVAVCSFRKHLQRVVNDGQNQGPDSTIECIQPRSLLPLLAAPSMCVVKGVVSAVPAGSPV